MKCGGVESFCFLYRSSDNILHPHFPVFAHSPESMSIIHSCFRLVSYPHRSPAHIDLKFSAVRGTMSLRSSKVSLDADPPIETSKNTVAVATTKVQVNNLGVCSKCSGTC